jgi:CHAT domain-containing protein
MSGERQSIAEYGAEAAGVESMRRWGLRSLARDEGWLALALCVLLCACKPILAAPPVRLQSVLPRQCLAIDGSHEIALALTSPTVGMLRVELEERGISTVSFLNDVRTNLAAAPIDRLGTVVLTADVNRSQRVTVGVRADDSREVRGEVCVSADLLPPSARVLQGAERAFAAAGRATRANDWDTAFAGYLSAARAFDELGLPQSAAMARHAMAEIAYRRLDRKRDAYALAGEAWNGYGSSEEPVVLGVLAGLEAKALYDMPGVDPAAAAPTVRRWLAVARRYESADRYGARELPRVDIVNGFLEYLLNAHEASRASFTRAVDRCRALQDWDCYAQASQNLAQLAEQGKNYSFALTTYAEALRRLPAELNPKMVADIWNNLGRLQGIVGLFSASERSHTAAIRVYAKLGDCQGARRSLNRVGALLVHVGNLADAQSDLGRAASLDCGRLLASAAAPAGQTTADPVLELDRTRRDSVVTSDAAVEHACERPLDPGPLTRETKAIVLSSLLSLASAAMFTGDSGEVWRCLDAAQLYSPDSRNQVRLANARGAAFLDRNDAQDASAAFARALRIVDEAGLPPTYDFRGSAQLGLVESMLLAGRSADSVSSAFAALTASTARGDIESTITSLRLIAAGYRGSGHAPEAVRVLQVAADLIEAVPIDELNGEQRATFLASQHTVFAELTDIFASQAGADDSSAWLAFEASERGRARSLRYALNQETRDASSPVDAPPTAKYQRLLGEVVAATAATVTADSPQRDAQSRSALINRIDTLALRESPAAAPFDRAQLRNTLKQLNATLVEYASGSKEMLAFVINGEHVRVVHLGDSREIARATATLRDRLRDTEAPADDVRSAAQALARLVLWPITAYLPDGRIVIVPDDALHTVPIAVLPWAADASQLLMLQHAETAVIPSALFLMRVRPQASAHSETPRIALIGDPVFRVADWRHECTEANTGSSPSAPLERSLFWTESLPRLPGTRLEVTAIARLAHESRPGSRIETLVGCAAVPTALRKAATPDVDLLHIATHARIDAQRPRLSALALTPESPADVPASTFGLLDILGLKLNSKLVVLSACDTSRGKLLPGEGVLGPAQAFLQAGSAAVLASYWRVDDQITSTFMQRFYKYLLVDRLSASAALRKTQLESAASGKTYEWAAFSLYGWPDSSI